MRYLPVVPAIIPKSQADLEASVDKVSFASELQLDLVDGKFAPTISWPYEPIGDPQTVKSILDPFTLEVDLMVSDPITAARIWEKAGADMFVFHIETISLADFVAFANSTKVSLGVSAHGDTSLDELIRYAVDADYIQLMGIETIGAQGLPFDETVLDKIIRLRKEFPEMSIGVDGSVNSETIRRLKEAGADRFICGSAIIGQADPEAAHSALTELIND